MPDTETIDRSVAAQERAMLVTANRTLTARNGQLAEKTRQASLAFSGLAAKMYAAAPPPVAEVERAAAYFADSTRFEQDFAAWSRPAPEVEG